MLKMAADLLKSNIDNLAVRAQCVYSTCPTNLKIMGKFGVPKRLGSGGDCFCSNGEKTVIENGLFIIERQVLGGCGARESARTLIVLELAALASKYKPEVNLTKDVADFHAPDLAVKALNQVLHIPTVATHQYTRSYGHPRLVKAISDFYGRLVNKSINPMTEVLITIGTYEALYSILMGHIEKGDEVIVIEPFVDIFESIVRMAGGSIRTATLRPPKKPGCITKSSEWCLDNDELASLFNETTKMIILNNPHNPVGKCYSQHELMIIANLCIEYNVVCLCDEGYEWIVFPYTEHVRMASMPGMWERTITVGSSGKAFNVTGWKLGWVYGPCTLMKNIGQMHQTCVHCCCSFLQEALAVMFEYEIMNFGKSESTLLQRSRDLVPKRDFMVNAFKKYGFIPTISDGTFFFLLNYTRLLCKSKEMKYENDRYQDMRFIKFFMKKAGILLTPLSPFYIPAHRECATDYVRATFLRKDQTLQRTEELLEKWYKS